MKCSIVAAFILFVGCMVPFGDATYRPPRTAEEVSGSWIKFLQKTDANSDQNGHWYIEQLYLLCLKFTQAYMENNLNEVVASLAESVLYMQGLVPHITCASIRCAYIQIIHQVQVLLSKNPQGQRGFQDLYEYLQQATDIVNRVILPPF